MKYKKITIVISSFFFLSSSFTVFASQICDPVQKILVYPTGMPVSGPKKADGSYYTVVCTPTPGTSCDSTKKKIVSSTGDLVLGSSATDGSYNCTPAGQPITLPSSFVEKSTIITPTLNQHCDGNTIKDTNNNVVRDASGKPVPCSKVKYIPLEPGAFKGVDPSAPLGEFLGQVFKYGIAIAITLAMIMVIYGGILKMTTDSWSKQDDAKKYIENALYGLGLALISWLLLYTINPCLVDFTNSAQKCGNQNSLLK